MHQPDRSASQMLGAITVFADSTHIYQPNHNLSNKIWAFGNFWSEIAEKSQCVRKTSTLVITHPALPVSKEV